MKSKPRYYSDGAPISKGDTAISRRFIVSRILSPEQRLLLLNTMARAKGLKLCGTCKTCNKAQGIRRFPLYEDKNEAVTASYISCQKCFSAVWAGEN